MCKSVCVRVCVHVRVYGGDVEVPLFLLRWLMKKNPQERPTAKEVLASGLLPPRVQDEQVRFQGASYPRSRHVTAIAA